jgi:hypothetical protein
MQIIVPASELVAVSDQAEEGDVVVDLPGATSTSTLERAGADESNKPLRIERDEHGRIAGVVAEHSRVERDVDGDAVTITRR